MSAAEQIDQIDDTGFRQQQGLDGQVGKVQDIADAHRQEGQDHQQDEERVARPVGHLIIVIAAAGAHPPVEQETDEKIQEEDARDGGEPEVRRERAEPGDVEQAVPVDEQDGGDEEDGGHQVAVAAHPDAVLQRGAAPGPQDVVRQVRQHVEEAAERQQEQQHRDRHQDGGGQGKALTRGRQGLRRGVRQQKLPRFERIVQHQLPRLA